VRKKKKLTALNYDFLREKKEERRLRSNRTAIGLLLLSGVYLTTNRNLWLTSV